MDVITPANNNGVIIPFKKEQPQKEVKLIDFLADVASEFQDADIIGVSMAIVYVEQGNRPMMQAREFIPHGQS